MRWDGAVVYQSARSDAYHAALHRLREKGLVYPCACSRREIADSAMAGIEGPVYPGTCRGGLPPGRAARSLRLDTRGAAIEFMDALQGGIRHDLERDSGDFVLYRADEVYAYQLATAVDDAEQGVTHVVRGADLLVSTPRQIHLQALLEFPRPCYAHVPVALDETGEKLSKQTHAAPVDPANPLPALIAALTFLGHRPPGLAWASVDALWKWAIANWALERVPRVPAVHAPSFRDS